MNGQVITFRARIHTLRRMSAKFVFLVFRQQTITIQGVLQSNEGQVNGTEQGLPVTICEQMVRSVEHLPTETVVLVTGKLRRPPQEVKGATIHNAELDVLEIHVVSKLTQHVPFTPYDAENVNLNTREDEGSGSSGDEEEVSDHRKSLQNHTGAVIKHGRFFLLSLAFFQTIDDSVSLGEWAIILLGTCRSVVVQGDVTKLGILIQASLSKQVMTGPLSTY